MPDEDDVVLLNVSGATVLEALENSVSQWPKLDGRFAAVSGLNFKFDSSKPQGHRVIEVTMWSG